MVDIGHDVGQHRVVSLQQGLARLRLSKRQPLKLSELQAFVTTQYSIGVAAVRLPLKIGNRQRVPDLLPEKVRGPETPVRMPGFEYARAAKRGDQ